MDKTPLLSILTPTFNRAHLLGNCYTSLQNQTDYDFEWIIIDDGSSDETAHVVSLFQENLFPIVFLQKENGGKHTALNKALPHIRGKYILILDSDDTLTENAVFLIREAWSHYESTPDVAIVTFLKGSSLHHPNCTAAVTHRPVNIFRCRRNILVSCDCCEVIRSEIMKAFPFPDFAGERFLSEAALWNRVASKYQCVYINTVIYLCQYLADGLTKSGRILHIRNPIGGMYCAELSMHRKNRYILRLKNGILFCCYGFFANFSVHQIVKTSQHKILTPLCLVPGWILYLYWKYRNMRRCSR